VIPVTDAAAATQYSSAARSHYRCAMNFDETYSDSDFQRALTDQHAEWLADAHRPEPDLNVDGLRRSLLSRLLAFFD
jgi:hypothetical protein